MKRLVLPMLRFASNSGAGFYNVLPYDSYVPYPAFQEDFLGTYTDGGDQKFLCPLPTIQDEQVYDSIYKAEVDGEFKPVLLEYVHFSLAMNKDRKFACFTACNVDGTKDGKDGKKSWEKDGRIPVSIQTLGEYYKNDDYDRGHLVRRLDPGWGVDNHESITATQSTYYYTNSALQWDSFNQEEWLELENLVLHKIIGNSKGSVYTGPIFEDDDPEHYKHPERLVPQWYWKVVVTDDGKIRAWIMNNCDIKDDKQTRRQVVKDSEVHYLDVEHWTGLKFDF